MALRLLPLLSLPLLAGCSCTEEPVEPVDSEPLDTGPVIIDRDGDGWDEQQDCDDHDAGINPDAEEICDELDNDCDEYVDEDDAGLVDGVACYPDLDGDGFGAEEVYTTGCDCPDGYVADDTDCNDQEPTINPDKLEMCDGIDNDCDGEVDEDGALYGEDYLLDADGDGYGDPDEVYEACELPDGYVDPAENNEHDCDDSDPQINPAADEVDDGVDNDCDGFYDEYGVDRAAVEIWGESAYDRAGRSLAGAGDLDGDGDLDLLLGARGDDDAGSEAGALYVVDGAVTGTFSLSGASAKLSAAAAGSYLGQSLDAGRDLDGDGHPDLIGGAPYADDLANNAGAAWVLLGPVTADASVDELGVALMGEYESDLAGWSVAMVGDTDGDGHGEVLVGTPYGKVDTDVPGLAQLVDGPFTESISLADADAVLQGENHYDGAGARVAAAGDVNGDGLADLLVGANSSDAGGSTSGAAYLVLGPVSGALDLSSADARWHGESSSDMAGYGLGGAGDVDGDGLDDMLVGAPYEDAGGTDAGAAYLLLGPSTTSSSLAASDAKIMGGAAGDSAGQDMAGVGDVDGDGLGDLVVGAPVYRDGDDSGFAGLFLGPVDGALYVDEGLVLFQGEDSMDYLGFAVGPAGDVDGDGHDDILLGAPLYDAAGADAGAAYLVVDAY